MKDVFAAITADRELLQSMLSDVCAATGQDKITIMSNGWDWRVNDKKTKCRYNSLQFEYEVFFYPPFKGSFRHICLLAKYKSDMKYYTDDEYEYQCEFPE